MNNNSGVFLTLEVLHKVGICHFFRNNKRLRVDVVMFYYLGGEGCQNTKLSGVSTHHHGGSSFHLELLCTFRNDRYYF
jgi:hypothetical protein